ncbi:phage conserved hypothetical protein BR0599 [Meinhardsimonia xiamenensis]|jgi:uncharacterized phage protein (TIGR02218 family)|uniref:Bacteriophage phiJL001 Gp84 C-terminal domain-containing protein n=1 Tax=Meinhardsimonia xiamenensis TaxID=990712 RepID=A0A1G9AH64_9RHOB|nr:DUF2163 domain-containing protein [Meinhardsimonia xiamenensis]PRX35384.1 putative phage protein (TIGR02218 family) [Meinhardsimonia xiamenensis]SDK26611.1 phage conserved hypothetical protein BR0599 [Meinhardsimonia xiamenensis]
MTLDPAFEAHLASGVTTVCRCWLLTRRDGTRYGFTDHDEDILFDAVRFRAETGISAGALQQSTGLSVDNAEAVGALSSIALTEADIEAGRFDGAEVLAWLVNWANPEERALVFRGTLGEIRRAGGAFHAELRGLTEALNTPVGGAYQKQCAAILGDARCGVDLSDPAFSVEAAVVAVEARKLLVFEPFEGFAEGWFEAGMVRVITGAAAGLAGVIRMDRAREHGREIALWQALAAAVEPGDLVRLEAGCDKRFDTCKAKFGNHLNFRGFPHIPGEDWLMSYPSSGEVLDGGKLVP